MVEGSSHTMIAFPALSKSIQELEEGLAAQLFFRRSKGVTLTDAGESFLKEIASCRWNSNQCARGRQRSSRGVPCR
ncbi:LysR family transcriptional regulator, partial [Escherichia coli]|nr:LysR family transcriptional regulator [Escherichia coli]